MVMVLFARGSGNSAKPVTFLLQFYIFFYIFYLDFI